MPTPELLVIYPMTALDLAVGQSRRLRLMTRLRSESSASPIRSIR
jgi:hypothetical protein